MSGVRMRRWFSTVIAVLSVAALAGCVSIPTTGSVTVGQTLAEEGSGVEFLPFGPLPGATQEEILRGFVEAFNGSAEDYRVARQFLSTGFSDEWNPRSNVTVRSGPERFVAIDDDTMEYALNATATVDATGAYRQNDAPVPQMLRFDFVQEDGEWRIAQASDGIVLSEAIFGQLFDEHAIYFLDPTNDYLVPDVRWFPGGSSTLRIVSALLAGPPAWLQGAVRTAFPDGTQLATPKVEVQSGVALVDLTTDALAADQRERQLMQLQLTASLANVPNIRRVSISVGGAPLTIPDPGGSIRADPQVDPRLLVLKDGEFGYLANGEVSPMEQLSAKLIATDPRGATVSSDEDAAAVLGAEGVSVVQAGDIPSTLLDTRTDLAVPSLDDYGYVWVASRSDPTTLTAYTFAGEGFPVATGLPAGPEIVSIDVSRDGARIAILLATTTGPRLVVKAINRDPNASQLPIGLSEAALDANVQLGDAIDATWVDELTVATLTDIGGQASALRFELGGARSSLGQPASATALVGGNGEDSLRALSPDGTVLERSGNGWTDTGIEVSFIATQR